MISEIEEEIPTTYTFTTTSQLQQETIGGYNYSATSQFIPPDQLIIETDTESEDWEDRYDGGYGPDKSRYIDNSEGPDRSFEEYREKDTPAYYYTMAEITSIYQESIQKKWVIANQPITRGGSRCTLACDTENHHVHYYCTLCKTNLPYGTTIHDCNFEDKYQTWDPENKWGWATQNKKIGWEIGQVHPDMDPAYLVNDPWWKEPKEARQEKLLVQLRKLYRIMRFYCNEPLDSVPFYSDYLTPKIVPLD
jgi:hypothetical protein